MEGPRFEATTMRLFAEDQPKHRLDDRPLHVGDRTYRIFRAVPRAEPPADGWPSLWATDGNAWFDRLPADLLASRPGLAIVGVGYETDLPFDVTQRALDLTPGPLRPDPRSAERSIGGAETFLEHLVGALRTHAETDTLLDPHRRTLAGHSYGGLFALWARQQGADFARFGAASPALWLDDLDGPALAPAALWIAEGEGEKHGLPQHAHRFAERARARGEDVALHVLTGRTHGETLSASLPGLLAFSDPGGAAPAAGA